jgi:hypothetical protein
MLSTVTNGDSSPPMNPSGSVEPLWTLRRDGQSLRAELCRTDQDRGWEVYLFNDKQRIAGHRLGSRGLALAWADSIFDGLVAEGWVPESRSIQASWGHSEEV